MEVAVVVGARATMASRHRRIMPRSVVAVIGNFLNSTKFEFDGAPLKVLHQFGGPEARFMVLVK